MGPRNPVPHSHTQCVVMAMSVNNLFTYRKEHPVKIHTEVSKCGVVTPAVSKRDTVLNLPPKYGSRRPENTPNLNMPLWYKEYY